MMLYIRFNPRDLGLEGFLESNLRYMDKMVRAISLLDEGNEQSNQLIHILYNNIKCIQKDLTDVFGDG